MAYKNITFATFLNSSEGNYIQFNVEMQGTTASSGASCSESVDNSSGCQTPLPRDMVFNDDNVVAVAAYTCLFVVAACGNLTVFITLFRNRHMKSRVNLFILHLSIADLIVTFIMLPLEISWSITVAWKAGDVACRILMFFRTFGLYLSSFILVTISLDRYFAILHPLSLNDADKRGKIMLTLAWSFSFVASVPQSVIFHVEHHPKHSWFTQCVTFNFFPTEKHELAYNLFNIITLYGLPLLIISASYSLILFEISRKTKQSKEETSDSTTKSLARLRRSSVGNIRRARSRTLKMTLVIVGVFVLCWTPYFVLATWWWFDRDSAKRLDPKIQKGLFLFAVSNSCMDPIVYGMFTINFKKELIRCCSCFKASMRRQKMHDGITVHYRSSTRRPPVITKNGSFYTSVGSKYHGNKYYESDDPSSTRVSHSSGVIDQESPMLRSGQTFLAQSNSYTKHNSESRANINNFMTLKLPIETHNSSSQRHSKRVQDL